MFSLFLAVNSAMKLQMTWTFKPQRASLTLETAFRQSAYRFSAMMALVVLKFAGTPESKGTSFIAVEDGSTMVL